MSSYSMTQDQKVGVQSTMGTSGVSWPGRAGLGVMLAWSFRFSYPTVLLLGDAAKLTRRPK